MNYESRIRNFDYRWEPPQYVNLPPSTYTKETRTPRFMLVSKNGDDCDVLIYFLNMGETPVESLTFSSTGFETEDDDEVATFSGKEKEYRDIDAGEAVLVDVINTWTDSDWSIDHGFAIVTADLGRREINAVRGKGNYGEIVLMWDTGEAGKRVYISEPSQV